MPEVVEALLAGLRPWYRQIQFVHLMFAMVWGWSTAVAYFWYLRVALLQSQRRPDDAELLRRRDWALEQFDRGVVLEHTAFPLLLATGLLLYGCGGWGLSAPWLALKLAIVAGIFVPMEIVDVWLSHLGGNLHSLRGNESALARSRRWHLLFWRITTPIVMLFVPLVVYLAVVKPVF